MSFSDIMETVLTLRGTNTATVKDIVDLRMMLRREIRQVLTSMNQLPAQLDQSISLGALRRGNTKRGLSGLAAVNEDDSRLPLVHTHDQCAQSSVETLEEGTYSSLDLMQIARTQGHTAFPFQDELSEEECDAHAPVKTLSPR